jgi:hypothetical protein
MTARAKNRKIMSGYHRPNCWWVFHQNSQEFSIIPSCAYHSMFRFAAQNGFQNYE